MLIKHGFSVQVTSSSPSRSPFLKPKQTCKATIIMKNILYKKKIVYGLINGTYLWRNNSMKNDKTAAK